MDPEIIPEGAPAPPAPSPEPTAPAPAPVSADPAISEPAEEPPRERDPTTGQFKPRAADRIAELTKARGEAEREAAYWRGVASKPAATPAPAPVADADEPKAESFDNYADYTKALAKYHGAQAFAEAKAKDQKVTSETQKQTAWQQAEATFKATVPDYDEVMRSATHPVPNVVLDAIREAADPALLHYMATHPEVAAEMIPMSERQALIRLGTIKASLTAASAPAPAPAARVSNAPPPIKPLGAAANGSNDLSKMSMDDYIKTRIAQGARWAR